MTNLFDGQVALITGGARGLGRATCEVLSGDGMHVIVADIRTDEAAKVAEQICADGGQAEPYELDVTNAEQAQHIIEDVVDRYGHLDVLINNAGTDKTVAIDELSIEDWQRVIDVNLTGPFLLSKFALPVMKEQGHGSIINITSTAAKRAWANASAYHASKWGLLGFSYALHVEDRPHGVKVTALVSGGMRTPFLLERFPDIDESTLQDPHNVAGVIRRILTMPEETVIPEVMVIPMTETSWP